MNSAGDMFSKAMAMLVLDHPFFASLALRLNVSENKDIETARTDGRKLEYSPKFVESLSMDELKGLICHEVMHCVLQHPFRVNGRHPRIWNYAIDYVVNPIVLDAGMRLPEGALFDEKYTDMSAEDVYRLIVDDLQPEEVPPSLGEVIEPGCGKSGEGEEEGGGESIQDIAQEWKVILAQAAQQAEREGRLPAGIRRLVKDTLEPKLDWREIFRRFITTYAENDYSWTKPDRRYVHRGLYLPSMYSNELGKVVAAIDVSGSISQDQLDQFSGEINSILQDYRAECKVIYCDAEVTQVDDYEAGDPVRLEVNGGGGTDFRPPFDLLQSEDEVPSCMLYFTDGMCSSFPEEPVYPTMWVVMQSGYGDFDPPFGEVLYL